MDGNKNIFDVSRPGAASATPTSRPTIAIQGSTGSDPMFAPNAPANPITPAPQQPVAPQTPVAEPIPPVQKPAMPTFPEQESGQPVHALKHQEAFYGHVGTHKKGKKLLLFFILVVLFAAAGYGAWMYRKDQDKKAATAKAAQVAAAAAAKDKTDEEVPVVAKETTQFTSKFAGFSLDNKYDWKVTEVETTKQYGEIAGKDKYSKVTFAINDKQSLVFDANPGGRGGSCQSDKDDEIFVKTKNCSSYDVLARTKITDSVYPEKYVVKEEEAYFIKFKYMGSDDDKPMTLVGLESVLSSNIDKLEAQDKPQIDAWLGYAILSYKHGYLDNKIIDSKENPTQLSDADLTKVEEVLKTFKLI